MIVITSAAYAPQELVSEVGFLPPSFLPIANRRLYEHQIKTLAPSNQKILLTIPDDFEPDPHDLKWLQEAGVSLAPTPGSLGLLESLRVVLSRNQPGSDEPIHLLHGDTWQLDPPLEVSDVVAVAANDGYYPRARVTSNDSEFVAAKYMQCEPGDLVLTGYFSFSDSAAFIKALEQSTDIVQLINVYQASTQGRLTMQHTDQWLDCGHVNAYYRSRATNTTERAFNNLTVEQSYIRKSSDNSVKIRAEQQWYKQLPAAMRHYAPQIGRCSEDENNCFYDVEYIYGLPLSDLLVFGRPSFEDWNEIFLRCSEFLSDCQAQTAPETTPPFAPMYLEKTEQRLSEFSAATSWEIDRPITINGDSSPSLATIAKNAAAVITSAGSPAQTFMHGDFCLSNILYDARARRIKVIDPRGLDASGSVSPWGETRYDLGKLFHSIIGGYDFVIAGIIDAESSGTNSIQVRGTMPARCAKVAESYRDICLNRIQPIGGEQVIAAISVHLFLSMLPLHADSPNRQLALLSRAVEIFKHYNL